MSPDVEAFVVPVMVLCMWFGSYYLNITWAKQCASELKEGSTYWFVRSNGMGGIKTRARSVWMRELGYEEPDALILAAHQTRANLMSSGNLNETSMLAGGEADVGQLVSEWR
jgi:hypothetical protein